MDMRFGMWNVRSHYRTGPLKRVVRELGRCKLITLIWNKEEWP
jgi:hypothetical protein